MKTGSGLGWALALGLTLPLLGGCQGVIHAGSPDSGVDGDDGPRPGQDSDGDGLEDLWELAADDAARLDPNLADSDGDGVDDGEEDYDADGLTNLQELAAARLPRLDPDSEPHPLRRDVLVELDCMVDRRPADALLAEAAAAWAALDVPNPDGSRGVTLHFVLDEMDLPAVVFDGSFEQRNAYLAGHGPAWDDGGWPPLPLAEMIHVVVAARRDDLPDRGGEAVTAASGEVEESGVFLYPDVIGESFPACGRPDDASRPDITPDEMLVATLVHELGHCLQLGHDTQVGGGVNAYNIMSVPATCTEAQMRAHGLDNHDPSLGNTEEVSAPRFSTQAAGLMDFGHKLSVDTSTVEDEDGFEM